VWFLGSVRVSLVCLIVWFLVSVWICVGLVVLACVCLDLRWFGCWRVCLDLRWFGCWRVWFMFVFIALVFVLCLRLCVCGLCFCSVACFVLGCLCYVDLSFG